MEPIVLIDKSIQPDDALILSIIGEKQILWQQIIQHLYENYTDVSEEWKYYNDGKSWLYRTIRKKKTIFWIGVIKDTFRITFWFPNRAVPIVEESTIPEILKEEFRTAKVYNTTRALSIVMQNGHDVEVVKTLIALKVKLK